MITCPKCGKDNQDHYKFCLGCGAELPRDAAPKPFAPQTPAQGMKAASNPAIAATGPTAPAPPIGPAMGAGGTVPVPGGPGAPAPYRPPAGSGGYREPSIGAGLGGRESSMGGAPGGREPSLGGIGAAPMGRESSMGATVAVGAPMGRESSMGGAPIGAGPMAGAMGSGGFAPAPSPAAVPPPAPPMGGLGGLGGASPAAAPAGGTVVCPQCGHINGPTNMFCGSCGFRLGGQSARPPAPVAGAEAAGAGAVVLTALRADGSEAGTYSLPSATTIVGRDTGGIFAGDSYLSPRHATFRQTGPGRLTVRDEASLNGVYKKLQRDVPVELKPNDVFRIGQEIIRFEPLTPQPPSPDGVERLGAPSKGYVGRIALIIGRDTTGNAFPVPESGVHLGRERGDVLFPEDGYVSGLHCRLAWEGGHGVLTDLGSSNGTFLRIKEETELRSGDVLLMGQQLFRITM